jgi:type II secretory pathway component PulF
LTLPSSPEKPSSLSDGGVIVDGEEVAVNTEEARFLNNLAVLLDCGRPLEASLKALREDTVEGGTDGRIVKAYDAMIDRVRTGGEFTDALGDYPELCSRAALALLRAGRRSGMLEAVLPKAARLVRASCEGEWDPGRRFLEWWAVMAEAGIESRAALEVLATDFARTPLGEVASGLAVALGAGKPLHEAARAYPECFDASARDLLYYGECRNLARALRAICQLV